MPCLSVEGKHFKKDPYVKLKPIHEGVDFKSDMQLKYTDLGTASETKGVDFERNRTDLGIQAYVWRTSE